MRLSALAYSSHLAQHLVREEAQPSEFWKGRAAERAAAITSATFVAVADGVFEGVADGLLAADGQIVEIGGMWVSPAVRRSGLGVSLLDAVCEWARGRGATRAGLWVRLANDPARLLYERAGFVAVSTDATRIGLRLEKML